MKGRNPHFIQLRNQHLIKRFYFWYEIERKRRDDVLQILSLQEVFLDVEYINHVIRQNDSLLSELRRVRPNPRQLETFIFSSIPVQAPTQQQLFQVA